MKMGEAGERGKARDGKESRGLKGMRDEEGCGGTERDGDGWRGKREEGEAKKERRKLQITSFKSKQKFCGSFTSTEVPFP